MIELRNIVIAVASILVVTAGAADQRGASEPKQVVLLPGQRVAFENRNGKGELVYKGPLERELVLDGKRYRIPMIARPEPFLGRMGIYNPASRSLFSLNRTPRIVAVESERHFDSLSEARAALVEGSRLEAWVFNSEGYVVGFSATPSRNQINITLYRYFIKGRPARTIPGHDDDKVSVSEHK